MQDMHPIPADFRPWLFWRHVRDDLDADSTCWIWFGDTDQHGYGQIRRRRDLRDGPSFFYMAHRVAYTLTYGEIPPGLVIDHRCRNRRCCNPSHLEAVTVRENTARGMGPKAQGVRNYELGMCGKGHNLKEVGFHRGGKRPPRCAECGRQHRRAYVARQRAKQVIA